MKKGTIVRLKEQGYGFIKTEDSEKDLFFHSNELQNADFNSLKEGDAVEFEVTEGQKGPQAVNVTVSGK
ncbi:MAG: cold shock domain-containing protein [Candidatus Pacebacteria bacterium]|nr:cold shock domain-containing protein [Candidatus Paceibacterota bacterium]